jgi:hypothetical protein
MTWDNVAYLDVERIKINNLQYGHRNISIYDDSPKD